MTRKVWRTPNGGTVITWHDDDERVRGWCVNGAREFLTRDLAKVEKHIESGYYTPADDEHATAVVEALI